MLPLFRLGLILLAFAPPAKAQDSTASSPFSVGIGYGLERFHWHETTPDIWVSGLDWITTYDNGPKRFVTEYGWRHLPFVEARYELVPGLRLAVRASYCVSNVNYDGGKQPIDTAALRKWGVDRMDVNGIPYYRLSDSAMMSITGYEGPLLDAGAQMRSSDSRQGYFLVGDMRWCYRSITRKLANTGARASGYDEIWTRTSVEISGGPGLKTLYGRAYFRQGLKVPMKTTEKIRSLAPGGKMDGVELAPEARNGWFSSVKWEGKQGFEAEFRYEQQTFDESEAVSKASQPQSLEWMGRLDVSWMF